MFFLEKRGMTNILNLLMIHDGLIFITYRKCTIEQGAGEGLTGIVVLKEGNHFYYYPDGFGK